MEKKQRNAKAFTCYSTFHYDTVTQENIVKTTQTLAKRLKMSSQSYMSCSKSLFLGQGMALLPCRHKRLNRTATRSCPTVLNYFVLNCSVPIMRLHCSGDMIVRRGTKRWLCKLLLRLVLI